jgi:LuxR family maltose regulon positive regulatory protein
MVEMQTTWLAQTKFIPPQLRDDFISRGRLLGALQAAASSHSLLLLSAPAGYGKTTLLASLSNKPIAWISLDEEDNDLTRFLLGLVIALQQQTLGFGENIVSLLTSRDNPFPDSRRILATWINEILEKVPEVWLVLDDLHVITEPAVYRALDYLLEHIPTPLHLIIATRHDPPLSLARLRARGQLAELRVPDLRFTIDEVGRFLNEKQCLNLSSDELVKLQSRAEGWAAGLRLLAGSLDQIHSADDRSIFIDRLTLTDRYVFDFLAEEVLRRQDTETRSFLLCTCILSELTPSLCNALTGRKDSQAILENLYRRNLFLTKAEEISTCFRYHALFAEFLRDQLKREDPGRVIELHRIAAETQKTIMPVRAVAHYLAAELWEEAAQTIEQVSEEFTHHGFLKTLRNWIEILPTSTRDAHPQLLYVAGLYALQHGELSEALNFLEKARLGFESQDDQTGVAETLLLMIDTVNRQHNYEREAVLTQQALKIPLPVHGQVHLSIAQAWQSLYQGNFSQAEQALDQALQLALEADDLHTFNVMAPIVNMQLTFLPTGTARLNHYCREVLSRFNKGTSAIRAGTLSLYSYLLFLTGAVEQAGQVAEEALSLCSQIGGLAYSEGQLRYVQGLVAAVQGDHQKREQLWIEHLPEMENIPSMQPFLVPALYFIGRAQWIQKKFDQARQTEARIQTITNPQEFPETMVTRLLMRALIELTDHRFEAVERTLQKGVAIEQAWPHAVLFGSARLMLAYLHSLREREKEAWSEFAPFLAGCEQRNTPGLILQETELTVPLLHLAVKRKSHADFAKRLLDQLSASDSPKLILIPETGQTLTRREVEVLKLIADGASNQVIAERLVISEHTVKVHITNLFAKLNVNSRTQAIARAHELRLV